MGHARAAEDTLFQGSEADGNPNAHAHYNEIFGAAMAYYAALKVCVAVDTAASRALAVTIRLPEQWHVPTETSPELVAMATDHYHRRWSEQGKASKVDLIVMDGNEKMLKRRRAGSCGIFDDGASDGDESDGSIQPIESTGARKGRPKKEKVKGLVEKFEAYKDEKDESERRRQRAAK